MFVEQFSDEAFLFCHYSHATYLDHGDMCSDEAYNSERGSEA